jgi:catechol 2,3-dioxygenase-like lactoylglutathione lyase family enzyme
MEATPLTFDVLDHFTVRCSPDRLRALGDFYAGVLGLRVGPRPDFTFDGLWLYGRDRPVVHLAATAAPGRAQPVEASAGGFDHVAFRAREPDAFKRRLQRLAVPFREQQVPDGPFQIFVTDPEGTMLEFNFDAAP